MFAAASLIMAATPPPQKALAYQVDPFILTLELMHLLAWYNLVQTTVLGAGIELQGTSILTQLLQALAIHTLVEQEQETFMISVSCRQFVLFFRRKESSASMHASNIMKKKLTRDTIRLNCNPTTSRWSLQLQSASGCRSIPSIVQVILLSSISI